MVITKILFLTVIGGVIGWITNVLAIKMLFRPVRPIQIPLTGFYLQGLIPKRRNEISKSIGDIVEKELISITEIMENILTEENKHEAIDIIRKKVITAIDLKMPSIIPGGIKKKIYDYIEEQIEMDGMVVLDKVVSDFTGKTVDRFKISQLVQAKIDEFELEKIESIIFEISSRELKHIEVLGGVLGAIIGLIQGFIVIFIG